MKDLLIQEVVSRIRFLFPRRTVPILVYHQIEQVPQGEDPLGLTISPEKFDRQMKLLSDRGFRSISLGEHLSRTNGVHKHHRKTFILTFDDGYLDNYKNAFPILIKYGLTATIFLVSDYVGKMVVWGTRKGTRLMGWEQAREMSKHGISFQSHTCTHPDLTTLDDKSVFHELLDSKKRIEDILGLPVRHLAYPSGRFDKRIIELVKEADYQSAYSYGFWLESRFAIERFNSNAYGWKFKVEASVWGSWLRHIRHSPKAMWNLIREIHGGNS